jgi:hypothetical protein
MNCWRASSVDESIHASPPGQPFTLGGEKRFCPSAAQAKTAGRRSAGWISNVRSVPATSSTGDFTSAPRCSSDQNASDMRTARSRGFIS